MSLNRFRFLFLNVGHFFDHFFMLIFATAALRLTGDWGMSYAELIPYATPGFIAFALFAIPAGWLADRWSRDGMMVVFFIGIGVGAILAGTATTPLQMAVWLTWIGAFAAIYHPVGISLVVQDRHKTGVPLAINGIFGNMGVASAALLTGVMLDTAGWQLAFVAPGLLSIAVGLLYLGMIRQGRAPAAMARPGRGSAAPSASLPRSELLRVFGVILFTTAIGGVIFHSTTFALPKVLDERLAALAATPALVGGYVFVVFAIAAFGQLLVGYLVDRYAVRVVFAAVALLQALFLFAMTSVEGVAALWVAVAFTLAVFGQIPINDVLVGRVARGEWRSRAFALRYVVTLSAAALAVPLIAWIQGSWGLDRLFGVLAGGACLVFLAVLWLPETRTVRRVVPAAA